MFNSRCMKCPHIHYIWCHGQKEYPQMYCVFPNEYSWPTTPPVVKHKKLLTYSEAVHKTPKWCPLRMKGKVQRWLKNLSKHIKKLRRLQEHW